jgi:hypothetical protein
MKGKPFFGSFPFRYKKLRAQSEASKVARQVLADSDAPLFFAFPKPAVSPRRTCYALPSREKSSLNLPRQYPIAVARFSTKEE